MLTMNSLGRNVPNQFIPYGTPLQKKPKLPKIESSNSNKLIHSMSKLFDLIPIQDGMTLSFHHHLRNGDGVLNM
ncbi:MAG: citrate lyase subunit alpha, partial [Acholeplasmataceae bacterium]|nr:citrate lyase subunit alpha [Acholeplasmataceae bacterium]